MKRFFVLFALLMLVAGSALAQGVIYEHNNEIGIYTTANPDPAIVDSQTSYTGTPGSFTAYVVCTNPYNTNINAPITSVGGFEFRLVLPASAFLLAAVLPPASTNFATSPDFLCGSNAPVVDSHVTLLTLTIGEFSGAPGFISLSPVQDAPQSVPGEIAITDFNDDFSISVAHPVSGSFDMPVFGLYQPVVPNEDATWGGVKSLYR